MKVKDLIENLQKYDPELEVKTCCDGWVEPVEYVFIVSTVTGEYLEIFVESHS